MFLTPNYMIIGADSEETCRAFSAKKQHTVIGFVIFFVVWVVWTLWILCLMGCAYGQGYYLFPERHGYHFNPCQHYDWVRPQDRDFYVDECRDSEGWRQYARNR